MHPWLASGDRLVDLDVVAAANAANVLMARVFLARAARSPRLESALGLLVVATGCPLGWADWRNAALAQDAWAVALPAPFVLFCLAELVLDYVLRISFRTTWLVCPISPSTTSGSSASSGTRSPSRARGGS